MRVATRRLLISTAVAASVGVAAGVPLLAKPEPIPVQVTASGEPVPGKYIVTLKPGASTATEAGKVKAGDVQRFDGVLNGFSAELTADQLNRLRRSDKVQSIEQDQVVKISTVQRDPVPWGLDRIDQRAPKLSKTYTYQATGRGVTAYVIDTGVDLKHPGFGGRARTVWTAARFNGDGRDLNGHGTHVAGIIGARHHGVAKNVRLRSLRVLDRHGQGSMSDVIAAVRWLRRNAQRPAVANLSLNGGKSKAADQAVTGLSRSGVAVVAAAGNGDGVDTGYDACRFSPSGAGAVITVGATTIKDKRTPWSNFGRCVDLHAPGFGIRSTWPGGRNKVLDGTSMAAPFTAGTVALYLAGHRAAGFAEIQKWLIDKSTKGRISGLPSGTHNRLLFKGGL